MTKKVPNPGSDKAIKKGCVCPVLDNAHGKGAYGSTNSFWISGDCPLHRPQNKTKSVEKV